MARRASRLVGAGLPGSRRHADRVPCVDGHDQTEQRLFALPVWRETPFFTARERAALAFTETVTRLSETHVPMEAYDDVASHFAPTEVAALLSLIMTINAWNAVGVATRTWEPGSYQP